MAVTIKQIEDALIAAIRAAMPYLQKIDTYSGELDEKKIIEFVMNFPAVLIYLDSNEYTDRAWPYKWQHPVFSLLVCDKNLRDNASARRGDGVSSGTYQMLIDLFDALFNKDLGLEMDPFDILTEDAIINVSGLSVYGMKIKTKAARN